MSGTTYRYIAVFKPGGPEALEIREAELPTPKAGEVRIRVETCGVAFPDTMIRSESMVTGAEYPVTLGYDAVGIVDQVGQGVANLHAGQRVIRVSEAGEGGYAEMLCHAANDLVIVPEGVEPGAAVSVGLNGVMAYQMVHRMLRVKQGERVLVHAAGGGIGHLIVQLCNLAGAKVYATASASKHDTLQAMGAIHVDNRLEDFQTQLQELEPNGVDAIFDCIGGENLKKSFDALAMTGRLLAYGSLGFMSHGVLDKERFQQYRENPISWLNRDLVVNNKMVSGYAFAAMKNKHHDWFLADLKTMLDLVATKHLTPIIGARMPFDRVRQAHELADSAAVPGKIVLDVNKAD